jgi:hypothetical protein
MRACLPPSCTHASPPFPCSALRLSPCAQLLWSFAALTILPVALDKLPVQYSLAKQFPRIPHTHVDVVSGAAAAVAFIGELFMIKAMLVYDDKRGPAQQQGRLDKVCAQDNTRSSSLVTCTTVCFRARQVCLQQQSRSLTVRVCACCCSVCLLQHRPVLASAVVVVLGLLLSITGFLLLMALEYMPDPPSR